MATSTLQLLVQAVGHRADLTRNRATDIFRWQKGDHMGETAVPDVADFNALTETPSAVEIIEFVWRVSAK